MKNKKSQNTSNVSLNDVEIQSEDCRPINCATPIGGNFNQVATMEQDEVLSSVLIDMSESERLELFLGLIVAEEVQEVGEAA